jgi:hypothetical protein
MRFKAFIAEAAEPEAGKMKFKGVYNWHKENVTLYCTAASPVQANVLLQGQLAKKLGVTATRVKSYYNQNQNGYKVSKVDS